MRHSRANAVYDSRSQVNHESSIAHAGRRTESVPDLRQGSATWSRRGRPAMLLARTVGIFSGSHRRNRDERHAESGRSSRNPKRWSFLERSGRTCRSNDYSKSRHRRDRRLRFVRRGCEQEALVASMEETNGPAYARTTFRVRYEFPSFVETSFSGAPQRGQ